MRRGERAISGPKPLISPWARGQQAVKDGIWWADALHLGALAARGIIAARGWRYSDTCATGSLMPLMGDPLRDRARIG
jgi:hypothetical protein